jgi:hypothetical protein
MSPWATGRAEVADLIAEGRIARLTGADAGREGLMHRAQQQLTSATTLAETDPATAYVIAYDAAKHAAMAILSEQNLRPTAIGGHLALEKVLAAQFGGLLDGFGRLRRRRNELDYPSGDEDFADTAEATRAIASAAEIVEHAETILDRGILTVF